MIQSVLAIPCFSDRCARALAWNPTLVDELIAGVGADMVAVLLRGCEDEWRWYWDGGE